MFKLRTGRQGSNSPAQPPSIEAIRQRARHRLIGASVLVLAGIVGFPLLFDTQPRPISVDIPIDIPAKNTQQPLASSVTSAPALPGAAEHGLAENEEVVSPVTELPVDAVKPIANGVVPPAGGAGLAPNPPAAVAARPAEAVVVGEEVVERPAAEKKVEADKSRAEQQARAEAEKAKALKAEQARAEAERQKAAKAAAEEAKHKAAEAARAKEKELAKAKEKEAAEAARAKATLEDKSKDAQRLVVQVGAFAEQARAQEVRSKLERAGLKTYTHVAETAQGQRIRVRVGPFSNKADADKAAAKIKGLGLPASVLTL